MYFRVSTMAGVPEGRGPIETCLRRCSHARLPSNAIFGAICPSLVGAIGLPLVSAILLSLVGVMLLSFVGASLPSLVGASDEAACDVSVQPALTNIDAPTKN